MFKISKVRKFFSKYRAYRNHLKNLVSGIQKPQKLITLRFSSYKFYKNDQEFSFQIPTELAES